MNLHGYSSNILGISMASFLKLKILQEGYIELSRKKFPYYSKKFYLEQYVILVEFRILSNSMFFYVSNFFT